MTGLRVNLGARSYEIIVETGSLRKLGNFLLPFSFSKKIFLVTNELVGRLYGKAAAASLQEAGFEVIYKEVPDGEQYKTLAVASELYDCAVAGGVERGSALIALGGGVVGDLAGFVASTYMRGIPFVQVPTTLLAQVDSSVGGKVAVNHPQGKNLIGCFYQPRLVFTDVSLLKTLHPRELRSGLAEVIKYGVIWDADFFAFLEDNLEKIQGLDPELLKETVKRACSIKAEIVEKDEREEGLRALLNFGHTIGHALETLTDYRFYRHGEAVALGMAAAAALAVRRGQLQAELKERLIALLKRAGLATCLPTLEAEAILGVMKKDKKVEKGQIRFVLPLDLGHVDIFADVEDEEIKDILKECREP